MSDKQPMNLHINMSFMESIAVFFLTLLVGGLVLLVVGLANDNRMAYAITGAIVAVALMVVGGLIVIGVLTFAYKTERGRERREQDRFEDNARENLAIMAAMQKVQNQQNTQLLKQARETQRILPEPRGDVVDIDALLVEEDVFAELED